jgi:hypothetical protein
MVESNALSALLARLHPDPVEAAEAYRDLQQRLVRFFNLTAASDPQQLADETIKRLAQRAAEDAAAVPSDNANDSALSVGQPSIIRSSGALAFGVAREILQEDLSRIQPNDQAVREWIARTTNAPDPNRERRQAILRSCLSRLSPERRRLLETYYGWSPSNKAEHHLQLAQSLGLNLDALRHRVLRSRVQLESCVRRKQENTSRRSKTKGRTS